MASFEGPFRSFLDDSYREPLFEANYIAPEIYQRDDVAARQAKLAKVVSAQIIPRLMLLHTEALSSPAIAISTPSEEEIVSLAHLVLSPDVQAAAAYITMLRERGLAMETLFVELLEPAARHLGAMWDRDECDFIDVTLGLGRLQKLLAIFNCTHAIPALNEKRRVITAATPGDQHSFGLAMVNKFLSAGGWTVESEVGATQDQIAEAVQERWFAVAGLTLGSERHIDALEDTIQAIRRYSANPTIGIMVGGPIFSQTPNLALRIGADATAINAPTAVLLAQKLFDIGMLKSWTPTATPA